LMTRKIHIEKRTGGNILSMGEPEEAEEHIW